MKINGSTALIGSKVILVPYLSHHVEKYHGWMSNEELRELTASEPLTLEEEHHMQRSWAEDEDKCTFIVLDKVLYGSTHDEVLSMIGDTNVFLSGEDTGEIEIMVAADSARGSGKGKEATLMMLRYCVQQLKLVKFQAKIGYANKPSINMFTKLQFGEVSRSDVFQEVTLTVSVSEDWVKWLENNTPNYSVEIHAKNKIYAEVK